MRVNMQNAPQKSYHVIDSHSVTVRGVRLLCYVGYSLPVDNVFLLGYTAALFDELAATRIVSG